MQKKEKITSSIDKNELNKLLKQLVRFDTINDLAQNKKLSKECPEFIVQWLEKRGISARIYEEEGFNSVYGKIENGKYHILLMAHYDVVPVGNNWKTNPFEMIIKDNKIAYGRGVVDNKNNVASIMMILPELKKIKLGEDVTICFELSGDEEIGGIYGAGKYREKFGRMPDVVMNLDGHDELIISRRRNGMGALITIPKKKIKIIGEKTQKQFFTEQYGRHTAYQTHGASTHCLIKASEDIAFNNWKVSNCKGSFLKSNVVPDECTIEYIVPKEIAGKKEFVYDEGLTKLMENLRFLINTQFPTEFSIYGITIGPNILSEKDDFWELTLDIRAMTQDYNLVETALKEMCTELFGEKGYQLTFKPGQGKVNTAKETMLIKTAEEVANNLLPRTKITEMGGASDARYFSREGIPTFDFGPIGGNVHANDEWVDLESFYRVTEFYFEVVKTLAKKRSLEKDRKK